MAQATYGLKAQVNLAQRHSVSGRTGAPWIKKRPLPPTLVAAAGISQRKAAVGSRQRKKEKVQAQAQAEEVNSER